MWIKSQDKNHLVKVIRFSILKIMAGPNKAMIYGYYAGSKMFHNNGVMLGEYITYKEATKALEEVEKAMASNPDKLYFMK